MKVYHGLRTEHGSAVVINDNGVCRSLDPRHDLRNHSPTGFEWGYSGSGPAQLALALAADVLGDDEQALAVYQRLKFKLVGGLPRDEWLLSEQRIRDAIAAILAEVSRVRR